MSVAIDAPTDEFARHFSLRHRGLLSYRRDGRILIQRAGECALRPFLKKKSNVPLDEWIARKQQEISVVPAWCFQVSELPSMEELEEWASDSVVETPTGSLGGTRRNRTRWRAELAALSRTDLSAHNRVIDETN